MPTPKPPSNIDPMRIAVEDLHLPEDLLTYQQAWEMLGKSRTTLRKMVKDGELTRVMVGGRPRILRPSVTEYLRRQLASAKQ